MPTLECWTTIWWEGLWCSTHLWPSSYWHCWLITLSPLCCPCPPSLLSCSQHYQNGMLKTSQSSSSSHFSKFYIATVRFRNFCKSLKTGSHTYRYCLLHNFYSVFVCPFLLTCTIFPFKCVFSHTWESWNRKPVCWAYRRVENIFQSLLP